MSDASRPVRIAVVGLGFGAEFIPIHQRHPHVELAAICQRSEDKLNQVGDAYGVERRYTSYADLLTDKEIDAVHINSPIPDHAPMSLAALEAGKHVMCTVPMATTVEDCKKIVDLSEKTGLKYMMAETVVYAREFLFVKQMADAGELGDIQFLQASHQQDMDGWPDYWPGLPPMHYATHCVGPCLALQRLDAEEVSCFGSGEIREELISRYGSPFAIESAHVKLRASKVVARVIRSLFDTARQYRESFDVYGSKKSFEWQLCEGEEPVIHTAKKPEPEIPTRVAVPDFAHLLPEPIQRFTTGGVYDADDHQHLSFTQGGGHGGSHPHLVHEFATALVEGRDPYPNARQSANWTCTGLLAHESAMDGGAIKKLPEWTFSG
ncbi:gfo/Idh/MocA family oxidoreductase [bacterium]|jgi:predicted dehydrogenase|nr:Gfo/Idh/MocA family oxidoreductase [Pirellulales bacterium]NBP80566.1 gfo/Idh/MocA family oxidoreductase [bacterium]